jgi:hypothetical protein
MPTATAIETRRVNATLQFERAALTIERVTQCDVVLPPGASQDVALDGLLALERSAALLTAAANALERNQRAERRTQAMKRKGGNS